MPPPRACAACFDARPFPANSETAMKPGQTQDQTPPLTPLNWLRIVGSQKFLHPNLTSSRAPSRLPEVGRYSGAISKEARMCNLCSMKRRRFLGGFAAATGTLMGSRVLGGAGALLAAAHASAAESVILGQGRYRYRILESWGE